MPGPSSWKVCHWPSDRLPSMPYRQWRYSSVEGTSPLRALTMARSSPSAEPSTISATQAWKRAARPSSPTRSRASAMKAPSRSQAKRYWLKVGLATKAPLAAWPAAMTRRLTSQRSGRTVDGMPGPARVSRAARSGRLRRLPGSASRPGGRRTGRPGRSVRSPSGSPREVTTSAASSKPSSRVYSLTVTMAVRPAPTAASNPWRESSTTAMATRGRPRRATASS